MAMEEGPEFVLSNEELTVLANELLGEKQESILMAPYACKLKSWYCPDIEDFIQLLPSST